METSQLVRDLVDFGHVFFIGVPDSTLKGLTEVLDQNTEVEHHVAANEGIALSIAAGYQMSSSKTPVVYLQNSGLGNLLNPFMSLAHQEVFDIPILFLIGWRGMNGMNDEPQHLPQGRVTEDLLKLMDVQYKIIKSDKDYKTGLNIQSKLQKSYAFLFPPKILSHAHMNEDFKAINSRMDLSREQAIGIVLEFLKSDDVIISTTGKASRELNDIRKEKNLDRNVFMNIGSMGHASSIAYGLALNKPENRIVVFDGDGALQMHLGALCNLSNLKNQSFLHILLANGTHASVGGSRIANSNLNYSKLFTLFNYTHVYEVSSKTELIDTLSVISHKQGMTSIIININNEERDELARPSESPIEQKQVFKSKIT
jgi:phosphonopyruvate decarboxylase